MAEAKSRASHSKVKDLLYGGDPNRALTPVKHGKRSTYHHEAASAPFAVAASIPPSAAGQHPNMHTSYAALNVKNRDGAGKVSSQDFGNDVYAANRALNNSNMALSRKHASEGNGSILSYDTPAGGPTPAESPRGPHQDSGHADTSAAGALQEGGQRMLQQKKKEAEERHFNKVGAAGAFDSSVYANSRASNMDSKNAVAERNRGSANLITNGQR